MQTHTHKNGVVSFSYKTCYNAVTCGNMDTPKRHKVCTKRQRYIIFLLRCRIKKSYLYQLRIKWRFLEAENRQHRERHNWLMGQRSIR